MQIRHRQLRKLQIATTAVGARALLLLVLVSAVH